MDRSELLAKIDDSRKSFFALLDRLTAEQMLSTTLPNGWTIKDMLAHLAAWENRAAYLYEMLAAGQEPQGESDFNAFNARVYSECKDLGLEFVLEDEKKAFARLRGVAATAPEEALFNPAHFAWTQGDAFEKIIGYNTYGHYEEHFEDVRRAVGGQ